MKAHRGSSGGQRGFLLLEVLISILIFSFAILGLIGLQARAVGFSVDAEDRDQAAVLADHIIATMWVKQTTDRTTLGSDYTAWQTRVQAALPPYNNTDVTATVGDADSNGVVAVKITWKPIDNQGNSRTYQTKAVLP
jgi:type IV pilus assembly protein PilV